jgi:hypothetical protein
MAKYVLLANIGNRDVMLAGQEIRPTRARGKEILDHFAEHQQNLTFPILGPVIRSIQASNPEAQLDLVLFCTNQEDAEERFKANDTLYFAECIKKLLSGRKPVGRVTIQEIAANPNLAGSMFPYFSEQLLRMQSRFGEYEKVFVALAGGIPACNMALCLQTVRFFEERCVPLYPIEGNEEPVALQIGSQLLASSKRDIVCQQLNNYEYALPLPLLDNLGLNLCADLARLALYRLNFDFQRARALARDLVNKDVGEVRRYGLQVARELQELSEKNLSRLILELYHNAAIKFQKKEYLDFIRPVVPFPRGGVAVSP